MLIDHVTDNVIDADTQTRLMATGEQRQASAASSCAPAKKLDAPSFAMVVASTPLVAIDLIVEDAQGAVLLGMRNNPPAKDYWFVPGGRIRKNETLAAAFSRIVEDELGCHASIAQSKFLGVHEHFYDTDFTGSAGASTHYVVLAYRLQVDPALLSLPLNLPGNLPTSQHSSYLWLTPNQIARHPKVHAHVHAYF